MSPCLDLASTDADPSVGMGVGLDQVGVEVNGRRGGGYGRGGRDPPVAAGVDARQGGASPARR